MAAEVTFSNFTFKDIFIVDSKFSPGVILGPEENPFVDFTFDNVVVTNPSKEQFDDYYYCENVEHGFYRRGTWPGPKCFRPAETCDENRDEACAFGYFCEDQKCVTCPEGSYCSDGWVLSLCPNGTWSEEATTSVDDCYPIEVVETTTLVTSSVTWSETTWHDDEIDTTTSEVNSSTKTPIFLVNFLVSALVSKYTF